MTSRERYLACLRGDRVDRPPFFLYWGPWGQTWERWKREGMPGDIRHWGDIRGFFNADPPIASLPVNVGPCPPIERKVVFEDDQFIETIDSWGIRRRDYKHGMSMPEFLSFPIKSRDDWVRFRDAYLNPEDPRRLSADWRGAARTAVERGQPIRLGCYPDGGVFGSLRWLMGDEECLIAFYEDPALVHEIMERITDVAVTVYDQVAAQVRVDEIHIWEDMAGRQGPLIGPDMWRQFMGPCYRRFHDLARRRDIPVISVDTDGQPEPIIQPMIDHGVNLLFPLEVAAGCDVEATRRRYPTLALLGGIDKRALAGRTADIDAELRRIIPAARAGGYVPELDHLIPEDVSWANFSHYARRLRAMLEG